jgi:aspartate racemase
MNPHEIMKTLGLIGGMSWQSTVPYYQIINRTIGERLGGLHSAKILLYSVDFIEIERFQREDRWDEAGELLAAIGGRLEDGGADFLVLCANTMHKVAPAIEARVRIPLLHIVDPTANVIRDDGLRTVGLLGTRYTMEGEFFRDRLEAKHGLQVIVPPAVDREIVHKVIFQELCLGKVVPQSRLEYRRIIAGLVARGAQGIILGCTEISMLVNLEDSSVPLFDTAAIHARAAALVALGEAAI